MPKAALEDVRQEIRDRVAAGQSMSQVSRDMGIARDTVRKYGGEVAGRRWVSMDRDLVRLRVAAMLDDSPATRATVVWRKLVGEGVPTSYKFVLSLVSACRKPKQTGGTEGERKAREPREPRPVRVEALDPCESLYSLLSDEIPEPLWRRALRARGAFKE